MKFGILVRAIGIFFISLTTLVLGCGDSDKKSVAKNPEKSPDRPYTVVCTIGMITDIVRNVVKEHAKVEGIIGEGVDPHLYKPTRSDVVKLNRADIVFYNGLLLEGKMTDVLVRIASSGKPVRAVTEAVLDDTEYLLEKDDTSGHIDPHVWMDVQAWIKAVEVVAQTLSTFDPENSQNYSSNAEQYIEKLQTLDSYAKESIASIPESKCVLITAHDAFKYMGRATGLTVRGIQGISTESEAGVRDLEELIDFVVEKEIPAIFVETSVSDKNVKALVEGSNARNHSLQIGGTLFSDAMGKKGTYEGTYIGMIDHNVTTITQALGGNASKGGMQGKLGKKDP